MAKCSECGGNGDCRVYEIMDSDDGDESVKGTPHCHHCAIKALTAGDPPAAVVYKSNLGVTTDQ